MSDTTHIPERSGSRPWSTLGIAAAACVVCCIGPILAVLGPIATLGLVSTIFIGAAGLLVTAAAIAAFVVVRRRHGTAPCAIPPERVLVELGRRAR